MIESNARSSDTARDRIMLRIRSVSMWIILACILSVSNSSRGDPKMQAMERTFQRAKVIYQYLGVFAPGVDRDLFLKLWLERQYRKDFGLPKDAEFPKTFLDSSIHIITGDVDEIDKKFPAGLLDGIKSYDPKSPPTLCPECGAEIPAGATVCPKCHPPVPKVNT